MVRYLYSVFNIVYLIIRYISHTVLSLRFDVIGYKLFSRTRHGDHEKAVKTKVKEYAMKIPKQGRKPRRQKSRSTQYQRYR